MCSDTLALTEASSGPGDSQINACIHLITAYRAAGDRAQAEGACRDCWQMLQGWLPVTPAQPVLRGLAGCCLALVRAHLEAGDFQDAADRCEEGLALLDGILDAWPTDGLALPAAELFALQRDLYGVSVQLDRQLGMPAEATADELMRQAAEHCLADRLDLAGAAVAADRAGDREAARDRLAQRSLTAYGLYSQANTVANLRRLAEAYLAQGAAYPGPKQAERLAEAASMWTALSQRFPASEYFAGRLRRTQTLLDQAHQAPS